MGKKYSIYIIIICLLAYILSIFFDPFSKSVFSIVIFIFLLINLPSLYIFSLERNLTNTFLLIFFTCLFWFITISGYFWEYDFSLKSIVLLNVVLLIIQMVFVFFSFSNPLKIIFIYQYLILGLVIQMGLYFKAEEIVFCENGWSITARLPKLIFAMPFVILFSVAIDKFAKSTSTSILLAIVAVGQLANAFMDLYVFYKIHWAQYIAVFMWLIFALGIVMLGYRWFKNFRRSN